MEDFPSEFFDIYNSVTDSFGMCKAYYQTAAGLSQSELARHSGVSIRIIQVYEQRMRDINKAQLATIAKIAHALDCDMLDLLEK